MAISVEPYTAPNSDQSSNKKKTDNKHSEKPVDDAFANDVDELLKTRKQTTTKPAHKVSYCHFFSNFGKCNFEDKNGRKCKFSHEKAPLCNFDGKCNRQKCMYAHSRANQQQKQSPQMNPNQNPFLDQGAFFPTNPWEMMSAFLQAAQNQPKPWNPRGGQGKTGGRF